MIKVFRIIIQLVFISVLFGCDDRNSCHSVEKKCEPLPKDTLPINYIRSAYFLDTEGREGRISGTIAVEFSMQELKTLKDFKTYTNETIFSLFWLNGSNLVESESFLTTNYDQVHSGFILEDIEVPTGVNGIEILAENDTGLSINAKRLNFNDFTANHSILARGGNWGASWIYGEDKPKLQVNKSDERCMFDNGIVAVVDMQNTTQSHINSRQQPWVANTVEPDIYPAYSFDCKEDALHDFDKIEDDYGIWTYSANNDAYHWANITLTALTHELQAPPLSNKLWLRTHYGPKWLMSAYWDGAYINLSDGYPFVYSMAVIDVVAHEIGHVLLAENSDLNPYNKELSLEAMTAHEAFGDIVGVLIKSKEEGQALWLHGDSHGGPVRDLSSIFTEYHAVASYWDLHEAGDNYYLSIGLITYPFYLLANQYDVSTVFKLFYTAASTCWSSNMTLLEAAECILKNSDTHDVSQQAIIDAFAAVKIVLDPTTMLSYFTYTVSDNFVSFVDQTADDGAISHRLWSFGDDSMSEQVNPEHKYQNPGRYMVTLKVTYINGKEDFYTRYINI